jgi:hypothetical protein
VSQRPQPALVPLASELSRRYFKFCREACYAFRSKVAAQQARRLTDAPLQPPGSRIFVANGRGGARNSAPELFVREFAGDNVLADERIAEELPFVIEMTKQMLDRDVTSRFRVCSGDRFARPLR